MPPHSPLRSTDIQRVAAVIPAWNEAASIGPVIDGLFARGMGWVVVGDNDSDDGTAAIARAAGAEVVHVARRGYGSACLGALEALPTAAQAVLFCDADGADDLDRIVDLVGPVLADMRDLQIGSRTLGGAEPGALTAPQRIGNLLSSLLMRLLYRRHVSDLGPFRCISRSALERLHMEDPDFGWTAEMQVKAFRLGLRYGEVPVRARCRRAGTSKISGNLRAGLQAGLIIISTILKYHRLALVSNPSDT